MLKLGKENIIIKHGCRFSYGDNLSPILFIDVFYLVADDILEALKAKSVIAPNIMCDNLTPVGFLKWHKIKHGRKKIENLTDIFTRVDDSAALFNNRDDMNVN